MQKLMKRSVFFGRKAEQGLTVLAGISNLEGYVVLCLLRILSRFRACIRYVSCVGRYQSLSILWNRAEG